MTEKLKLSEMEPHPTTDNYKNYLQMLFIMKKVGTRIYDEYLTNLGEMREPWKSEIEGLQKEIDNLPDSKALERYAAERGFPFTPNDLDEALKDSTDNEHINN